MSRRLLPALAAAAAMLSTAGAITVLKGVAVNGKTCDVVTWSGRQGRERSIALLPELPAGKHALELLP